MMERATVKSFINTVFKGLLLTVWILALAATSLLAVSGRASDFLLNIAHRIASGPNMSSFVFTGSCVGASEQLTLYLAGNDNAAPPIQLVLDAVAPAWKSAFPCEKEEQEHVAGDSRDKYYRLFRSVEDHLRVLAERPHDQSMSYSMPSDLLSSQLVAGVQTSRQLDLPDGVKVWIDGERRRLGERAQRFKLLDTFTLLTVIGAFGSLVFMIREYVADANTLSVRSYIFRPVLGIFMAMAMFALAALAHAIVSNAAILEIRHEPLYVLALAAGLLSERAYRVIETRAGKIIDQQRSQAQHADPRA